MGRMSGRFGPINVISPKRVNLNKARQPSSSALNPRRAPAGHNVDRVRRGDLTSAAGEVGSTDALVRDRLVSSRVVVLV